MTKLTVAINNGIVSWTVKLLTGLHTRGTSMLLQNNLKRGFAGDTANLIFDVVSLKDSRP